MMGGHDEDGGAGAADAEFFARLAQLNDRFASALPQTLERLLAAHNAFDATHPQQALIDTLHATLHTLAGSSATFGFDRLGRQARALEERLLALAASGAAAADDWAGWLAGLRVFVDWAKQDPKGAYPNDESGV